MNTRCRGALLFGAAANAISIPPGEYTKEAAALVTDFGALDVNAVNNEGKTALDIAVEKNDEAFVKFLLKYN